MPGRTPNGRGGAGGGTPNEGVTEYGGGATGGFGLRCVDDDGYIANVAWLHTDVSLEKTASLPFYKTDAGGAGYLFNLAPGQFLNPGSGEGFQFDSLRYYVQRNGRLACHSTLAGGSILVSGQVPGNPSYSASSEVLYIALTAGSFSQATYDHGGIVASAGSGNGQLDLRLNITEGYPYWYDWADSRQVMPSQMAGVPRTSIIDGESLALTMDGVWNGTAYIPRVRFGSGPWIEDWVYEDTGLPWAGNGNCNFTHAAGLALGDHPFTAFRVVALKDGSATNSTAREVFFDAPDDMALVRYIESQL